MLLGHQAQDPLDHDGGFPGAGGGGDRQIAARMADDRLLPFCPYGAHDGSSPSIIFCAWEELIALRMGFCGSRPQKAV